MSNIIICDNHNSNNKSLYKYLGPYVVPRDAVNNLQLIADKSLATLKEENPNLLIFPEDLGAIQDGLDDQEKVICSLYPAYDKKYLV